MEEIHVYQKFGEVTGTPLFSVDRVTWHGTEAIARSVYARLQKYYLEMEKLNANPKSKKR